MVVADMFVMTAAIVMDGGGCGWMAVAVAVDGWQWRWP